MNDVVDKAVAWDKLAKKNAEIERLRNLLREVLDGAWEMDFEDRHTIDSEVIGKIATYLVALTLHNGGKAQP